MVARTAGQSLSYPSLSASAKRTGRYKQANRFSTTLSAACRRGGAATAAIVPVYNSTTGYYEVTIAGTVYAAFTDTEFPTIYGYNQ